MPMPIEPFSEHEFRLLDAIHDDPRSDAPRLTYADWLQANGHAPLAEFIRLQCKEPYFALVAQGNDKPRLSVLDHGIEYDDPARVNRGIELLRSLHKSQHFPDVNFWQEYIRGLPLYEMELYDSDFGYEVKHLLHGAHAPLARFRLYLRTSDFPHWLSHPIMRFVDVLRITPLDSDGDYPVEFTEDDIRTLERSPLLPRLEEIGLSATVPEKVRLLAQQRIEPITLVNYDY
jgi:uncharacterized protein (TIGR02996 family)